MLTAQDNELMCRVGPDTGQGAAMRRFWLPALLSSELPEPGGDPVAVQVLNENLVAFRGTDGKVGLIDEYCRHRGASLALGRVDECGVRCIYHGWKFGADGEVQETPNVADPSFKTRFKAKAYPAREAGGLVWIYMGDPAQMRDLPDYPFLDVPEPNRLVAAAVVNCNFVQVMEGLVDSSHLTTLHSVGLANTNTSELKFAAASNHMQYDAAPKIEAEETDFGFHYVAMRTLPDHKTMARVAAFQAPCFVYNPNGDLFFAVVPMTDERTMFVHVWWDKEKEIGVEPLATEQLAFVGLDQATLTSWGMTRSTADGPNAPSRANRYKQDRAAQRAGHFTGIINFTQEDAVVSLSSGAIRDRSQEMLAPADLAIQRLYRAMLGNARASLEGREPVGLHADPTAIKGNYGELAAGENWRKLVPEHRPPASIAAE